MELEPHPILVVDDNPELLDLIQMLVLNSGYTPVATTSSAHALELALSQPFSVLFTDLLMPVMDGHALISAVRQTPDNAELPVVMMSGMALSEQKIDMPGVYYLEKPFNLAEFNQVLEQALVWQQVD